MRQFSAWVERFLDISCSVLRLAAVLLMLGMVVLSLTNLGLRMAHQQEIAALTEWTEVLFVWMCFAGFFVIHRTRRDICVEVLVNKLSRSGKTVVRAFVDLVMLMVAVAILSQGGKIVELQEGVIDLVGIPKYDEALALFVVVGLIGMDVTLDLCYTLVRRDSAATIVAWQD